jgi:predicted ATPase
LPEALIQCASVQLFVDRAQAVRPDFQVTLANAAAVAAVCERLEGIPLAIELAAARALVITPAQMLARLEHRFELLTRRRQDTTPRHRSLRAALDWSFEMLAPELQRFFAQLSVFRGGWTLEAAEAVCGEGGIQVFRYSDVQDELPPPPEPLNTRTPEHLTLDDLEQLQQCSLVLVEESAGEMRYRLLETLREYGAGQLAPDEQIVLSRRHARFFLALAERAEPGLNGPAAAPWLERLALEEDNLRAALAWCQSEEESPEVGLRLAGALWQFWSRRGSPGEGRRWMAEALRRESSGEPALRAKLLGGAGDLALHQGDFAEARQLYDERLRLSRQSSDSEGMASSLACLGRIALNRGQLRHARSVLHESLSIRKGTGDNTGAAESLRWLGEVASNLGEFGAAHVAFEETLEILRKSDDTSDGAIRVYFSMGRNAREVGDYARARACFEQSLKISRKTDDKGRIAAALLRLADVAIAQGRYEEAASLHQQALTILREIDDRPVLATSLIELGRMAIDRGDYPLALFCSEQSLALLRELGDRWLIPYALHTLGNAARYRGEYARARSAHEESVALARETGHPWGLAYALQALGLVAEAQGEYERSQSLIEQSLCLWRRLENKLCTAMAVRDLASVAQKAGDYPRAQSLYRESLTLLFEMGHNRGVPRALTGCASLALAEGQAKRAARLLGAAARLQEVIDAALPPPQRQQYEQTVAETKAALGDECFAARWSEGRAMTLEEVLASLPSR